MGLIDIGAPKLRFAQFNKRTKDEAIFKRSDRALSNYQWLQL